MEFHSGEYHFACECGTFSTSLATERVCCHTRLMKHLIGYTGFDYQQTQDHLNFINRPIIETGITSSSAAIITLPSKSGVDRYSVVANGTCEFVTVFSSACGKRIARCSSGICRSRIANTRNVISIDSGCQHLQLLKPYIALIENIPDPLSSDEENDVDDFEDLDVVSSPVFVVIILFYQ